MLAALPMTRSAALAPRAAATSIAPTSAPAPAAWAARISGRPRSRPTAPRARRRGPAMPPAARTGHCMRWLNIHEAADSVSAASRRQRPQIGQQQIESRSLQIHAPRDIDRVAQRIDRRQILQPRGHAAERRGQAREQRERHDQQHRIQHRLLHGGGDRGQQQADADRGQQEQQQPGVQRQVRAGERNAKPELRDQQHAGGLDRPDQHRWQRLAGHDLERPERRHQQLIEGALLALARHRHRGQHHGLDQRQRADHAGNHVPAGLEIRVVPGAASRPAPAAAPSRARRPSRR